MAGRCACRRVQHGHLQADQNAELSEDLIRWIEDEKRFDEFRNASIGQAGPVYRVRAESPYWKSDPNFEGMMQNVLRGCGSAIRDR